MTDLVCPACGWTIQDEIPDRRCSLCGTSMEPDPRADEVPEVRATLGEDINDTIRRALNTANTLGPVVLIHNADRIMIWPRDTVADVHARRDAAYTERRIEAATRAARQAAFADAAAWLDDMAATTTDPAAYTHFQAARKAIRTRAHAENLAASATTTQPGGGIRTWETYRANTITYAAECCETGDPDTGNMLMNTLGGWAPNGDADAHAFSDLLAAREADGRAAATRAHAKNVRATLAISPPLPWPTQPDTLETLRAALHRPRPRRATHTFEPAHTGHGPINHCGHHTDHGDGTGRFCLQPADHPTHTDQRETT